MSITPENVEKLLKDVQTAIDILKQNKDWNIDNINGKVDLLQSVIVEVEKTAQEVGGMLGAEKKELAVAILNKLIDIPILPEWVEAKVIEYIIDVVIALMNKWFGKLWIKTIV